MLKLQSVQASLEGIEADKIPNADEVQECLDTAGESLRQALGYRPGVTR